jgi:hypothetical protein
MTKKTIFQALSIVLLLTLCVSFYSCKKEGIFNPKQQISKIYADFERSIVVWDPETGEYVYKTILFPKFLVQEWTWDKNKLNKIDFWAYYNWWEGEPEGRIWGTDRYYYEKNRLVKIDQNEGYSVRIMYDGAKFDKIEFFNDMHEIWLTMNFTYNNNKISNVKTIVNWDSWKKEAENKILATFLPKEIVSKLIQKSEEKKSNKSMNEETYNATYTYIGNNLKEMVFEYIDEDGDMYRVTANYLSYDSKHNPFYKKTDLEIEGEFMFGVPLIASKNNPLEAKFVIYEEYYGHVYMEKLAFKYTYTYDKNYPIEILSEITWDEDDDDIERDKVYLEYL